MKTETVVLLHGYASSGNSRKAHYFREKFAGVPQAEFHAMEFNPTPKDFEFMTVTGMINRLRQYLLDHDCQNVSIAGSSMGALVSLHYAHRFGGVKRLLFLAPALSYSGNLADTDLSLWQETGVTEVLHYAFDKEIPLRYDVHADGQNYHQIIPPPAPIMIIHGRNDDVVPINNSRDYAARYPTEIDLMEVDSDHRLNDQLDFIWEQMTSFFLKE